MFSKTCEYALRALFFIARRSAEGSKTGIKEIAVGIDAPEPFIAKILNDLSKKKLVQSYKGPMGGFFLNEKSIQNSVADVVKAVDGDKLFLGCGLGLHYCSEAKPCPIHHQFQQIRKSLYAMLEQTKLNSLTASAETGIFFLKQR